MTYDVVADAHSLEIDDWQGSISIYYSKERVCLRSKNAGSNKTDIQESLANTQSYGLMFKCCYDCCDNQQCSCVTITAL